MKPQISILLFLLINIVSTAQKTLSYKGLPVILAKSEITDYQVGDDWYEGYWSVAPEVENDT
ncbi:MAG: transglutaminase domain-containing protein, partial [Bacteroidota bacterium]